MIMNESTGVSSKGKRKFNNFTEEEVKQKNILESIQNEKEDIELVGRLHAIIRVKGNKEVLYKTERNSNPKKDLKKLYSKRI